MVEMHIAQSSPERKSGKWLAAGFEWVGSAVTALVAVALIFTLLFRVVSVDGASMSYTLTHGDRLVLSSYPYTPERGDIVVITRSNDSPLIKRVIGIAGDTIRIDGETGQVFRNDEVLDEPYILGAVRDGTTPQNGMDEEIIVPEGTVFAMGDNRHDSLDSRMLGCFPLDDVVGKVLLRLAPNPGRIMDGE